MKAPIIMKFGGTSVGDAEQIERVAAIIAHRPDHPTVIVASAMAGVTDMLVSLAQSVKDRAVGHSQLLSDITERHMRAVVSLHLDPGERTALRHTMITRLHELEEATARLSTQKSSFTKAHYDQIVSFGERLSVELVAAALRHAGIAAQAVLATECIVTNDRHGDAEPLLDESAAQVTRVLTPLLVDGVIPVVTGFIGATASGDVTTLGRGASDYTATILGYCLDAYEVWIWTDVTGVLTADPKLIPDAQTIDHLSYEEAAELSHFGAKVLHPLTIVPVSLKKIPIRIKNTFEHTNDGTRVSSDTPRQPSGVKAVTAKHNLSLVTVRGKGTPAIAHVAAATFGALAQEKIDIYLISHASSERNMAFVVASSDSERAANAVRIALSKEEIAHDIDEVHVRDNISMVAVVGDGMQQSTGITGQLFSALGAHRVNVVAVAQGQFESNMSCVVDSHDANSAVKSLHHAFNLKGEKSSWQKPFKRLLKR